MITSQDAEKKITPFVIGIGEEGCRTVRKFAESDEGHIVGIRYACLGIDRHKDEADNSADIDYVTYDKAEYEDYFKSQNFDNNPLAIIAGSMDVETVKESIKSISELLRKKVKALIIINLGNMIDSYKAYEPVLSEYILTSINIDEFSEFMKLLRFGDIIELTESDIIDVLKDKGKAVFLQGEARGTEGLKLAIRNAFDNAGLDMNDLRAAGIILGIEGDFSILSTQEIMEDLSSKILENKGLLLSGVAKNSEIEDANKVKMLLIGVR